MDIYPTRSSDYRVGFTSPSYGYKNANGSYYYNNCSYPRYERYESPIPGRSWEKFDGKQVFYQSADHLSRRRIAHPDDYDDYFDDGIVHAVNITPKFEYPPAPIPLYAQPAPIPVFIHSPSKAEATIIKTEPVDVLVKEEGSVSSRGSSHDDLTRRTHLVGAQVFNPQDYSDEAWKFDYQRVPARSEGPSDEEDLAHNIQPPGTRAFNPDDFADNAWKFDYQRDYSSEEEDSTTYNGDTRSVMENEISQVTETTSNDPRDHTTMHEATEMQLLSTLTIDESERPSTRQTQNEDNNTVISPALAAAPSAVQEVPRESRRAEPAQPLVPPLPDTAQREEAQGEVRILPVERYSVSFTPLPPQPTRKRTDLTTGSIDPIQALRQQQSLSQEPRIDDQSKSPRTGDPLAGPRNGAALATRTLPAGATNTSISLGGSQPSTRAEQKKVESYKTHHQSTIKRIWRHLVCHKE